MISCFFPQSLCHACSSLESYYFLRKFDLLDIIILGFLCGEIFVFHLQLWQLVFWIYYFTCHGLFGFGMLCTNVSGFQSFHWEANCYSNTFPLHVTCIFLLQLSQLYLHVALLTSKAKDWRANSAVKGTYCSSRILKFNFQCPHHS